MPTLEHGSKRAEALASAPFPLEHANAINSWESSSRARTEAMPLALLDKVREFRSAAQVRALGLYPYFRTISSAQDSEVVISGRKVLILGSNSYLGLTNHPKITEAAKAAIDRYGTGCAGSRFLNGTLDIHLELEQALARLVGKEAVLLYSNGFQANLGVISALVGKGEYVLADKNDHASIVAGCQLSSGKFVRFAHNNMPALEDRLQKTGQDAGKLIVVDGVFSMEGDIIQLPELCRLAEQYGAAVMVDDAHAIGVLGKNGAGNCRPFLDSLIAALQRRLISFMLNSARLRGVHLSGRKFCIGKEVIQPSSIALFITLRKHITSRLTVRPDSPAA